MCKAKALFVCHYVHYMCVCVCLESLQTLCVSRLGMVTSLKGNSLFFLLWFFATVSFALISGS